MTALYLISYGHFRDAVCRNRDLQRLAVRDRRAVARISTRIIRLRLGNAGDVAPVGDGVSELRLMFGPGYRIYYAMKGEELILLLAGGDKSTQARDIETAKELWRAWKEQNDG